jgi:hypothetical protein
VSPSVPSRSGCHPLRAVILPLVRPFGRWFYAPGRASGKPGAGCQSVHDDLSVPELVRLSGFLDVSTREFAVLASD